VVFVVLACAGANEPFDGGPGPSAYAGTGASAAGTLGASGSAAITAAGGARGGSPASGASGAPVAAGGAGNGASGGTSRNGGAAGALSRGGAATTGGRPSAAGATSSGGSAGAAAVDLPPVEGATFTDVYTQVISMHCFGSGCHNPSMGRRPDFSTQSGTYKYFKSQGQLYAAQDPQKSYIYSIMHGNPSSMPPTPPYMPPAPNPNVPPDALAIVAGWIAAGAQNN
jgi:hypothetical protein